MTNTLVKRNNQRALMAAGATALANYVGQVALSGTGQRLFWDGMKYVGEKVWNKKWRQNKVRDVVGHPGAGPGAVAAPVAISRIIRGSKPKFKRGKGSVTVTHRELIGQFNNSTDLVVNGGVAGNLYPLNPGNPAVFPWLQMLSSNFDQYRFDNVRLQYVPLCGTTTPGRVALFFDKDSTDPVPTERVELANMAHLTETSPWAEASLNIPVDSTKRFTNDNATADRKLIDLGQVGVATYGSDGTLPAGDVFVHYTVTFFEPQPSSGMLTSMSLVGTTLTSVGPSIFSVARSTTELAISFKTPGIYFVSLSLLCASYTSETYTTGTTLDSQTNLFGSGKYLSDYLVIVTQVNGGFVVNGTTLTNFCINAVRAKKTNVVVPI